MARLDRQTIIMTIVILEILCSTLVRGRVIKCGRTMEVRKLFVRTWLWHVGKKDLGA